MKVRLTQIIDYWVGIPICLLLSLLNLFLRPFRQIVGPPSHILFIELSEMGSALLAASAVKRAKERFPEAKLSFLIFEKNRESVDVLNLFPQENVLTISEKSLLHFVIDAVKFLALARREKIDTIVDLELFSRATMILSLCSGAKQRVGFCNYTAEGLYRGNLLTHPVSYNSHSHMSYNFIALIEALGSNETEKPLLKKRVSDRELFIPKFIPRETESAEIWRKLSTKSKILNKDSKLIILNPDPGEALPLRGWQIDSYVSFGKEMLAEDRNAFIVLMGLERSKPITRSITKEIASDRLIDFSGETDSLREVLTLFSLGHLLVTHDSGPGHFASMTNIKSIVLFGPETPVLYGPLGKNTSVISANLACSPCVSAFNHRHTACKDNVCMKGISARSVVDVARRLIASLCFIALSTQVADVIAEDQGEFFDKNYAGSIVEKREGESHPAFGESKSRSKNSKRIKEYNAYLEELKEKSESDKSLKVAPKVKETKAADTKEEISPPIADDASEESNLPFEPLDPKAIGGVQIQVYVSGEPKDHFMDELKRTLKAKRIPHVKVKEVVVIGKPFSGPELGKLMRDFNPKETPIKFLLEMPKELSFKYSPVWIVEGGGKKLIFEGKFKTDEILNPQSTQ